MLSRGIGLLFIHKNGCGDAISETERSCAATIFKVESHISYRCSHHTGELFVAMDMFVAPREAIRYSANTALEGKTTTLHVHHTFMYISFPLLHNYDVKLPNFTFYGGRKQATTKFYTLFAHHP